MKLKIIESPKAEFWASQADLSSILTEGEMGSITGGTACGVYNTCSKEGKSSCQPFDCTSTRISCTSIKNWVIDPGGWSSQG